MIIPETTHENSTAVPTIQKMPPAYSPVVDLREADRHEGGDGDQRAGQPRHRGRGVGIGGRFNAVPAFFHLHDHHLDRDNAVVHQQAERDDQRAERDALQVPAHRQHHEGDDAEHDRHGQPDDDPRAPAEAEQADREHNGERFQQRAFELPDGFGDDGRLIGDALELDAVGQFGLQLGDRALDRLAEVDDVAVVGHRDAEHQHLLSVVAHGVGRRIFVSARDRREIAELDEPAAGGDRHVADIVQSLVNWPLTRTSTRSPRVSIEPLASTLFWFLRLSAICRGVMPSAASRWCENST